MPILPIILRFVLVTLLKSIITANMVQDFFLWIVRNITERTKNTWDDKVYKKLRHYMKDDKSERPKL